jgi:hypothetical protein
LFALGGGGSGRGKPRPVRYSTRSKKKFELHVVGRARRRPPPTADTVLDADDFARGICSSPVST